MQLLCFVLYLLHPVFTIPHELGDASNNYNNVRPKSYLRSNRQTNTQANFRKHEKFSDGDFSRIPKEEFVLDDVTHGRDVTNSVKDYINTLSKDINSPLKIKRKNAKLDRSRIGQKKHYFIDPISAENVKFITQMCRRYLKKISALNGSKKLPYGAGGANLTMICKMYLESQNINDINGGYSSDKADYRNERDQKYYREVGILENKLAAAKAHVTTNSQNKCIPHKKQQQKKLILSPKKINSYTNDVNDIMVRILPQFLEFAGVAVKDLPAEGIVEIPKRIVQAQSYNNDDTRIKNKVNIFVDLDDDKDFSQDLSKQSSESIEDLVSEGKNPFDKFKPRVKSYIIGNRERIAEILDNQDREGSERETIGHKTTKTLSSPFLRLQQFRRQNEDTGNVSDGALAANRFKPLGGRREWVTLGNQYNDR